MIYSQLWEEWAVLFSSSSQTKKKREKVSVKGREGMVERQTAKAAEDQK